MKLDTKDTGGVVGQPNVGAGFMPSMNSNVDINGPKGEVETTYDHADLSKKYKYPQISQDVPEKGRDQFTAQN